jgi:hypothetical protein
VTYHTRDTSTVLFRFLPPFPVLCGHHQHDHTRNNNSITTHLNGGGNLAFSRTRVHVPFHFWSVIHFEGWPSHTSRGFFLHPAARGRAHTVALVLDADVISNWANAGTNHVGAWRRRSLLYGCRYRMSHGETYDACMKSEQPKLEAAGRWPLLAPISQPKRIAT